jgi:RNase P subunit RPR2
VDEIVSRTPDALFNGSAVVEILKSCVPSILDPWSVPSIDLNALLAAVRLASYGHDMEIVSTCPSCGHVHNINVDLRVVLDHVHSADYSQPLVIGDLTCYFEPMSYKEINDVGRVQFEDQKIMQVVNSQDISEEEKMRLLGETFKRITALTVKSIAASVGTIRTVDAMVTDPAQIEEFLLNCPKKTFDAIRDAVVAMREKSDLKPISMTCENCSNQYEQDFTMDMTSFFATAS